MAVPPWWQRSPLTQQNWVIWWSTPVVFILLMGVLQLGVGGIVGIMLFIGWLMLFFIMKNDESINDIRKYMKSQHESMMSEMKERERRERQD